MKISQYEYQRQIGLSRTAIKALKGSPIAGILSKARAANRKALAENQKFSDDPIVKTALRELVKAGFIKAAPGEGVTTGTGYNFYDLRGPALLIYPVNTPLIESIAREGNSGNGVGTAAHWQATRNPNATNVYAGLLEGQRNALSTPDNIPFVATYKELGMERGVTFTAQWAGEGFTDNMADEHIRGLQSLRLQEEMMTLLGNGGTGAGNNGFALGKAATPAIALQAGPGIAVGGNISVACMIITGMGMNAGGQGGYGPPPSVATGVNLPYVRQNMDGSTTNVANGSGIMSNMSAVVTTAGANLQAVATVTAQRGGLGYAWYVNTTDANNPSLANAKLYAITSVPTVIINGAATGTQSASVAAFQTDNSYQATDFDGLLTYAFKYGRWNDQGGASFTPGGNGTIVEIEADLQYIWETWQAGVDCIWVSSDVKKAFKLAVAASANGNGGAFRFNYQRDEQNNVMGGYGVSAYLSDYAMSPTGAGAVSLRVHPMLPQGTMYYDISTNPYPQSRMPAVRQFLTQRDYYSIEWPLQSREWTFGTYVHEVLAHYAPWISCVRTGIGAFVAG